MFPRAASSNKQVTLLVKEFIRRKRPFGYFWVSSKSLWPARMQDKKGMDANKRSACFKTDIKKGHLGDLSSILNLYD
jgi:hypothetical protein